MRRDRALTRVSSSVNRTSDEFDGKHEAQLGELAFRDESDFADVRSQRVGDAFSCGHIEHRDAVY